MLKEVYKWEKKTKIIKAKKKAVNNLKVKFLGSV